MNWQQTLSEQASNLNKSAFWWENKEITKKQLKNQIINIYVQLETLLEEITISVNNEAKLEAAKNQ